MPRKTQTHNNYQYAYTACRGPVRHRWDAVGPIPGHRTRATFGTLITFRCETCSTVRYDVVSRLTGDLLSRSYEHPDGYKLTERPSSQWLRAQWLDEIDNALLTDLDDLD